MKTLNKRQLDLLNLMLQNNFTYNRKILSTKLKVSPKTLSNDIAKINLILEDYKSKITTTPKEYVFQTNYSKIHWINTIRLNRSMNEEDLIAARLIFTKKSTLIDFATEQFISKSKLDKLLNNYKFKYVKFNKIKHKGFEIVGSEFDKMLELTSIIFRYVDQFNYYISINELLKQIFQYSLEPEVFKNIISDHQKIIRKYNITNDKEITRLFIICELITYRSKKLIDFQNYLEEFFIIEESEATQDYLSSICSEFLTANNIKFDETSQIYKALLIHLEKLVLMQETPYEHLDILNEIPDKFRMSYMIAEKLLQILKQKFTFECETYETNFITIYIQTLINLQNAFKCKKVLIVCQYGTSVSSYIQVQLEKEFGDELKIETSSINNFQNRELSDDEIIITTVDNLDSENTIHISPLPDEKELLNIIIQLRQKFAQIKLETLLNLEIFHSEELNSFKKLEVLIDADLINNSLVHEEYLSLYKSRVAEGLININGLIIIHGSPRAVYSNQLLSYHLQTPFEFQGKLLEHVLVLVVNQQFLNEEQDLIKKIYQLLLKEENIQLIKATKNMNQLKWIIKNKLK